MADIRHRGGQTMSYFSKRALRWTAPVALVGALGLAACGGNDSDEAIRTNAGPVAQASGLDNHLDIRAAEIATRAARLAAEAEQAERSAKLEGQAETYRSAAVPTNSDANLPNAFEAGNRAAQAAEAERYVEQQQDRAESNSSDASYRAAQAAEAERYVEQQQDRAESNSSYDDEFLPGSHHVPSR
jgi:hypothetical protein